ncbi:MAG: transferrin-binding protein-like solute binding protein [Alphaproteobacteria bacterium]|nr:transferrin-binding protein-like solute binding protein [Alphaproteobacteria bacterium]
MDGTADARFYGTSEYGAQEFGGTFALASATSYYYGAFGAASVGGSGGGAPVPPPSFEPSNMVSINPLDTVTVINPQAVNIPLDGGGVAYSSLTSISGDADANDTDIIATLQGLTVMLDDVNHYTRANADNGWDISDLDNLQIDRQITASRIIDSAVTLGFDADGTITRATVHADEDYINATVDRGTIFGFASNYMAYVSFYSGGNVNNLDPDRTTGTISYQQGAMIAGIDIDVRHIPSAGRMAFTGKGAGIYGNATTGYNTIFDVSADVNFGDSNVTISTRNTCQAGNCTNNMLSALDFSTGTLSYTGNNISGNATAGDLSGTVDARFYGSAVQEFGGTFALADSQSYYYGAFGAKRGYQFSIDAPTVFNSNNLTGFNDTARKGTTNNALKTTAVQITKHSDNTISNERILGAVAEFTYDADGAFSTNGFNLYYADKRYRTTAGDGEQDKINDSSPDAGDADAPYRFQLSKESSYFGFAPAHMALVEWTLSNAYGAYGYGITGFETTGNTIPSTGTHVSFTGKGGGLYYSTTAGYGTFFDITANVNFATREVGLASDNTCRNSASSCPKANQQPHLDFTGTLNYASGTNNITGAIATKGDATNTKLTGTADARFYGPLAQEFGGTFSLSNTNIGYVGWFGATYYTASSETLTTDATHIDNSDPDNLLTITVPTIFNANGLTSFSDEARKGTTGNALKTSTAVQMVRNTADKTIINSNITGAVAEFDYRPDGAFSGLSVYFADKRYRVTDTNGNQLYIQIAGAVDAGSADAPFAIGLYRYADSFKPDYMAGVSWILSRFVSDGVGYRKSYDGVGYATTGYETIGSNIPKTGITVRFTGKGQGLYTDASSKFLDYRYPDITADVNFATRKVLLTGEHNTSYAHLNFTGTLNYATGTNILTGTIATKGDADNAILLGTADARFYGPLAQEFGGTFSLTSDTAGYVGWFGAQRYVSPFNTTNTAHANLPTDVPTIPEDNTNTPYPDFNEAYAGAVADAEDKEFILPVVMGVTRIDTKTYSRFSPFIPFGVFPDSTQSDVSRYENPVVKFSFDSTNQYNIKDVTLYVGDKEYVGQSSSIYGRRHYASISGSGGTSSDLDLKNNNNWFGDFIPKYMTSIYWNIEDDSALNGSSNVTANVTKLQGYGLAGIETSARDIPAPNSDEGTVSFTGRGEAYKSDGRFDSLVAFLISADVNFYQRTAQFMGETTLRSNSDWDFSTPMLRYSASNNNISGDVTATNGAVGTLDARFYGTGTDAGEELGGTIILQTADGVNSLIGAFGTSRDYTSIGMFATNVAGIPTTFNANSLTSFNDEARKGNGAGTSNNALKINSAVELTTNSTLTNNKITDAVVEFDYLSSGSFRDGGLTIYLASRKYISLADGFGGSSSIGGRMVDSGTADTPDDVRLERLSSIIGNGSHMALVSWEIDEDDYDSYGYGFTGYVTDDSAIPAGGIATFSGKGRGRYYDKEDWIPINFDITAEVDFGAYTVNLASTKTETNYGCYPLNSIMSDCRDNLNWTGELSYAAGVNAITGDIATAGDNENAKLSGTAEANFYGTGANGAKEFGGTFSLQNNHISYIGFFGAVRGYIASSGMADAISVTTPPINQHGLTGFNDVAGRTSDPNNTPTDSNDDVGTSDHAIKAIGVEMIRNFGNQTIINNRITDAVAEFDYDATFFLADRGDFADTGFKFYFADKQYEVTNGSGNAGSVTSNTVISNIGDAPDYLYFFRRSTEFGFTPNYMALVEWHLRKVTASDSNLPIAGYDVEGIAITGFETTSILTNATISFTGKGRGKYQNDTLFAADSLYFNITATVYFGGSSGSVNLASSNSCKSFFAFNCTQGSSSLRPHLDFTGTLSYNSGANILTGANLKTTGDADNAKLSGIADARFYGGNTQELGGTFNMINGEASYIGWFGTERPYLISSETVATDAVIGGSNVPTTFNANNLTGFNDDARKGTTNNALKIGSAVEMGINKNDKTIIAHKFTDAVVEFDYKPNGNFTGTDLTLYFADKKYETTAGNGGQYRIDFTTTSANDGRTIDWFDLSRTLFGFNANYMARVHWRDTHPWTDNYYFFAHSIAGFETTAIPSAGATIFTGDGRGTVVIGSSSFDSYFGVVANVDFSNRHVTFSSENTCGDITQYNAGNCAGANLRTQYNFTGTLSYDAGINALTGNVTTAGDDLDFDALDGTELTGTADARFYGPLVEEFGGTFSLSNATSGYIGFFGAQRGYIISSETLATTHADMPTTFNANGLTSFDDPNRISKTGNALKATAVQITSNNTDKTIINDKITGAVVELNYDEYSIFANNGLTLYFTDKKYSTLGTISRGARYIGGGSYDSGTADAPAYFQLEAQVAYFGFTPDYMARVYWQLGEASYEAYGFAITGFETSNIPITGTAVIFTGKGRGQYYSATDSNYLSFNVTANVDFTDRKVELSNTNTCSDNNDCENTLLPHLNFTGTLNYVAGTNNISGAIETAGDTDNAKLTGTADARFYGPSTEELGGTFRMNNADAGYVGWFGAKK